MYLYDKSKALCHNVYGFNNELRILSSRLDMSKYDNHAIFVGYNN